MNARPEPGLFLFATAALVVSACVEPAKSAINEAADPPGKEKLAAVNVQVQPVSLSNLTELVTVAGTTIADADVTYSAEIAGRVEHMAAKLGDRVRRGQVLARIDYQMLKAQADAARATFDLAQKTFERVSTLEKEQLVSQQQVDEARSRRTQTEAQWRIGAANLEKSVVRATRAGTVAHKACDSGEFVVPGAPIYRVVDYRTLVIQAQLPETVAARVKKHAAARVRIDALGRELEGRVRVVVPAAAKESKTFELQVEVDNRDLTILVGMAATVSIVAEEHENVVVAPHDLVIEEANRRSVFVEAEGVAQRRTVELGAAMDGRVIVTSGVQEGDRLVVVGHRQLVDGQPIQIVE